MARTVQVSIPSDETDALLADVKDLDGIIGLSIQRGGSIQPLGDIVVIQTTTRTLQELMRVLDKRRIGQAPGSSILLSEPSGVISSSSAEAIAHDDSEASWEEMEVSIAKESNATANMVIVMAISGVLAAVGIATNALHLVIGAMLIAPGFEPLVRISLGIVGRSNSWRRGLRHTAQGYGALFLGAVLTALVIRALGQSPIGGENSYLPAGVLVAYWTTITVQSLLASASGSIAGAILVASNRVVLTGGVMVALALVPTMTITGLAIIDGNSEIAARSALRWAIEVGFVILGSLLVFAWKQAFTHRRQMLL